MSEKPQGRRKRWLWLLLGLCVVGVAWTAMRWPAFEVRAWNPPATPKATGVWKENKALASTQLLGGKEMVEPEDISIDAQGRLYISCRDGKIRRMTVDGKPTVFAETGGRPIGSSFGPDGVLYVADALKGLLAVSPQGKVTVLADQYKGKPLSFVDDLDLDNDGNLYFSDASLIVKGSYHMDVRPDVMSHVPTGRLFRYNLKTKKLTLLLDDLYFANGVALSHDRTFVLVVETAVYRVRRYWLKGPKKGQSDFFATNLRGFPDNINRSSDGGYWVAFATPRLGELDKVMHPRAWLKKFVMTLPEPLLPKPKKVGMIAKLNGQGKVVQMYADPEGKTIANITSVNEHKSYLYMGHIYNDCTQIGRWKIPKVAASSGK
ncbi:MAG: SMP-30/gluconolactonase/LRE family protein [Deltaproteobacteria bacterium]|nr:MAG: SMP-30/gluconolactonase/LRE family protein [Deltaproteobacteria bacterium]